MGTLRTHALPVSCSRLTGGGENSLSSIDKREQNPNRLCFLSLNVFMSILCLPPPKKNITLIIVCHLYFDSLKCSLFCRCLNTTQCTCFCFESRLLFFHAYQCTKIQNIVAYPIFERRKYCSNC